MEILHIGKYNKLWLSITTVTTVVSVALILIFKLNLGIDFAGGSVLDYKYENEIDKEQVNASLEKSGVDVSRIVLSEGNLMTIYTEALDEEKAVEVDENLTAEFTNINRVGIETVGPSVGQETTKKAVRSVIYAALAIIVYLTIAFRSVPKPTSSIEFGVSVIIAMLHDVVVVLGAFALLGRFVSAEIDALFITAILTVIGFSVHDSIVVFDRIRENLKKKIGTDFETIVSDSLAETLARSVNLSVSVLLTLAALFVLGSESIKWFTAALIIGMASGTYSSIFVASQVLLFWEKMKQRRRNR